MTLDESLNYAGSFSEGAGDTFVLSGGHLAVDRGGHASRAGRSTARSCSRPRKRPTVSGLTIGGTVKWENTEAVTQSGGAVTIGDASGDKAILNNTSTGTYDIADDSGIGLRQLDDVGIIIRTPACIEKTGVTTGVTGTT